MELIWFDWHPTLEIRRDDAPSTDHQKKFELKENTLSLLEALRVDAAGEQVSYWQEPNRFDFVNGKLLLSSNIETINTKIYLRRYRDMPVNNFSAGFTIKLERGRLNIENTPYTQAWLARCSLWWNQKAYLVQQGWSYGEYNYGKLKNPPKYLNEFTRLALNETRDVQEWLIEYGERGEVLK